MAVPAWRIYYGDGSTFSADDGPPGDAPKRGVQLVAQFGMPDEADGVGFIYGHDFYCWTGADPELGWCGREAFGLWEYLSEPGVKVVLFGRTVRTREFRELVDRVVAECRAEARA